MTRIAETAICCETAAQVHLGKLEMEEEMPLRVDVGDQMEEVDNGEEIYFDQPEELLPLQEQDTEFLEEDAWNLEEENDYFDPEEEISPFDLY